MAVKRRGQEEEAGFKRVTRHQSRPLARDETVWLQSRESGKWDIKGFVWGARQHGRSYIIETAQGSLFLRNRKFIRPRKAQEEQEREKEEESTGGNQIEQKPAQTQKKAGGAAAVGTGLREPASQPQPEAATHSARTYSEVLRGDNSRYSGVTTRSRSKGIK